MKRVFVSVFLLFMLSSCSVRNEQVSYPLLFKGSVTLTCNNTVFEADVSYTGSRQMKLEMTHPNELRGVILNCNSDNFEVTKNEVSLEYDKGFINSVPMLQLYTVLEHINLLTPEFTSDGEELFAKSKVDEINYEVRLDSENKMIKCIQVNNCLFEFK